MKETAVVICPGRGTYNKPELGYLKRYHSDKGQLLAPIDAYRKSQGQIPVTELDQAGSFRSRVHSTGENASALIYACAMADYLDINRDRFDIVGVTGNSMGWYLALACAGVLTPEAAIHLVNTMGTLMHEEAPGGQVIYPLVNEQWQHDPELERVLQKCVGQISEDEEVMLQTSIHLGGLKILAGNEKAVQLLLEKLPTVQDRYPLLLPNHGAFHSPLMQSISEKARLKLSLDLFTAPELRLIDGRGRVWHPQATDLEDLYDYTLRQQICCPYNYSKAIEVLIKELAPDRLIILGPGTTLGAPTAQELIKHSWLGLADKDDFIARQESDAFVLSMGYEAQRQRVVWR